MTTKKPRYLVNGSIGGRFVRAWSEGRGREAEIIVQIWNSGKPEGEPDGDWAMPKLLGETACVNQALAQTPRSP